MLTPIPAFLDRAAELHRIWGVRALHHHALEEVAAEHTVRKAEPLVKRESIGVRISAMGRRDPHGTARDRARSVAVEDGITREQRFEHRASLQVSRRAGFGHYIEDDQRAASEIVPTFESFTVSPYEAAWGELRESRERGPEAIGDGEQRAMPIPHRPGGRVDERAPTV